LWGSTTGSSSVTLTIWDNGKQIDQYNGVVQNSKWEIKLKSYPVSGPFDFVVKTGVEKKYNNIYFGDVFLCSGQSNMEMAVVQSIDGPKEVADSINYPQL
jgi:sialate O-acetylesterase